MTKKKKRKKTKDVFETRKRTVGASPLVSRVPVVSLLLQTKQKKQKKKKQLQLQDETLCSPVQLTPYPPSQFPRWDGN
jgi:hypothetical protein